MCEAIARKWRVFCNRNGPKILDIISPLWLLVTMLGGNWLGDNYVFEALYGDGTTLSTIIRIIVWFMSTEMIVHWLFLCKVKSVYTNTDENNKKRIEHESNYPQFTSEGVDYEKLREKRPTSGTGNWSVITYYSGTDMKRTAYPYWSWKPCIVCSCYKPARCHHCPICEVCVLKRDHHCFFARQCVGLNNQRYFVVFNFWATLATGFTSPMLVYYTKLYLWPTMSVYQLFLPWTLVSFIIGNTDLYTLAIVFQNYSLIFFVMTAGYFLYEQLKCIDQGLTSFEIDNKDQTIQTLCKSRYERFACVFGRRHIWLNFLIPYHWACRPTDDGISWASIKME